MVGFVLKVCLYSATLVVEGIILIRGGLSSGRDEAGRSSSGFAAAIIPFLLRTAIVQLNDGGMVCIYFCTSSICEKAIVPCKALVDQASKIDCRAVHSIDVCWHYLGPLCRKPVHLKARAADVGFMYCSAGIYSVLMTAWGSGQLQIDAVADEIQPQWNIGVRTRLNVDLHGQIKSLVMICDSSSQDPLALRSNDIYYRIKCEE